MAQPQGLRFVLVRCRGVVVTPPEWRATASNGSRVVDFFFFSPTLETARDYVRALHPGATFTDEQPVKRAKAERVNNVIEAIEAFTDAKIEYAESYRRNPEWANSNRLEKARDELHEQLAKALT